MKTPETPNSTLRLGLAAAVFFTTLSVRANPIEIPERPVAPKIAFLLAVAILLEVLCVWLILKNRRQPRLFVLWLIGMNLLTYPAFVGFLHTLDYLRPAIAVLFGEAVVILVEGVLIYLMCRFIASARPGIPTPSAMRCCLASLAGNCCSAAAFPLLLAIYDRLFPG